MTEPDRAAAPPRPGPGPRPGETGAVPRPRAAWAGLQSLSLRARLSLLAAVGVGLAVALVSVAAYATLRVQLQHNLDQALLDRARAAVSSPLGDPAALAQIPPGALAAADLRIALLRADGHAISAEGAASAPPLGPAELAVAKGHARQSTRTADLRGVPYRVVAVPAAPGFALVLAQPLADANRTLDRLGLVLLIVGGLGVAGAAWAGLLIGRAGLRPVQRLTQAAEHVARTGQLDPIAVSGEDELARLARAFNAMLAALAQSQEQQRRLVGDAGHELRTPLTSLRTNLDLLAQSDQQGGMSPSDRADLLADVRAQVSELGDLVGDLVELAREDPPSSADTDVDLGDVLAQAVERVRRRAPLVSFQVDSTPWVVHGDAHSLERAVTNLLDNAAKWSPPHATVRVALIDGALHVADEGPGIADADLPHVFDRFYRSPEARSMPGSGLGLAIVRQAAERHNGTVSVARAPWGGAWFTLRLPGRPALTQPVPAAAGTRSPWGRWHREH